jgi:hypothetical protein
MARAQVVEHRDVAPVRDQRLDEIRSDEPGAARDEDTLTTQKCHGLAGRL